jgi:maltooligosyltrehalose synthase
MPLTASGTFADCCVAFVREHEKEWIAVVVPRLASRVGFPPIGEKWKDTMVAFRNRFAARSEGTVHRPRTWCGWGGDEGVEAWHICPLPLTRT